MRNNAQCGGLWFAPLLAALLTACFYDPNLADGPAPTSESSAPTTGAATTTTSGSSSSNGAVAADPPTTAPADDTTSSTSTSTSTGEPCDPMGVQVPLTGPRVLLVLDKSASMVTNLWDHDLDANTAEITRWNSLHQAIASSLGGPADAFEIGLVLFPSLDATDQYDATACTVAATPELLVAPMNSEPLLAALPAADDLTLAGATPMAAAMMTARDHLHTFPASVPRIIVLVTDGAANCNGNAVSDTGRLEMYDDTVQDVVSATFNKDGIPTHVVGIAIPDMLSDTAMDSMPNGINPTNKLSILAVQGGRPLPDATVKFHSAHDQFQLEEAFKLIGDDIPVCLLGLDEPPAVPSDVLVKIAGADIDRVVDCDSESGWVYVNPAGPYDSLRFCGAACDALTLAKQATVFPGGLCE